MRVKELAENLKISTDELIKNLSNVIFYICSSTKPINR